MDVQKIISKAMCLLGFSTQTELGAEMGVTSMAISNWKRRGSIPDDKALWIYDATRGKITLKSMGKTRKKMKEAA